jgi:hypothetical protein
MPIASSVVEDVRGRSPLFVSKPRLSGLQISLEQTTPVACVHPRYAWFAPTHIAGADREDEGNKTGSVQRG